jgi:hypothetical protein
MQNYFVGSVLFFRISCFLHNFSYFPHHFIIFAPFFCFSYFFLSCTFFAIFLSIFFLFPIYFYFLFQHFFSQIHSYHTLHSMTVPLRNLKQINKTWFVRVQFSKFHKNIKNDQKLAFFSTFLNAD